MSHLISFRPRLTPGLVVHSAHPGLTRNFESLSSLSTSVSEPPSSAWQLVLFFSSITSDLVFLLPRHYPLGSTFRERDGTLTTLTFLTNSLRKWWSICSFCDRLVFLAAISRFHFGFLAPFNLAFLSSAATKSLFPLVYKAIHYPGVRLHHIVCTTE